MYFRTVGNHYLKLETINQKIVTNLITCKRLNSIVRFNLRDINRLPGGIEVKTKLSISWLSGIVVVFTLSAFCSLALAAEFSADMVIVDGDNTITNKLFVKDLKYRMETKEGDQEIIVIVDQGTNITKVLNINDKFYIEMPCDDMRSLTNDPYQSLKVTIETPDIDKNDLGSETVNGIECDKSVLLWGGTEFYTYCMSKKYDFPIKIIRGKSDMVVELKNIKESAIDNELFEIPEGFLAMEESQPVNETKREEPASNFPAWVVEVSAAEIIALPFEKVMSTGEIVRIKVKEDQSIFIQATNNHSDNSDFMAVPFLNGKPIMDPSIRAVSLMMAGQFWPVTAGETLSEADEIIVRVDQGEVNVKAEYNAK